MSNDETQSKQGGVGKLISPDPRIKITTSGGSSNHSVSFRKDANEWQYATNGSTRYATYTAAVSPITLAPAGTDTTVQAEVIDADSSTNYDQAILTQALVNDEATYVLGKAGASDQEFEIHLGNASLARSLATSFVQSTKPINNFYYIRTVGTDDSGNKLFAGLPTNWTHITTSTFESENDASHYQWMLIPSETDGDRYYIYLRGSADFVSGGSGTGGKIGKTSGIGASYAWSSEDGTITYHDSSSLSWTAGHDGNNVLTQNSFITVHSGSGAVTQQWELVPVELGPDGSGPGVLGPSSA